jgi:hypothetical protein
MVRTRATEDAALDILEGPADRGCGRGRGQFSHANPPPPLPHAPISIEDLLATQNNLMRVLVCNEANRGVEHPQHQRQQGMNMSYNDFLATHPPVFSMEKTCLMQMTGFTPPNQNLICYTARSTRRLCMPPSS